MATTEREQQIIESRRSTCGLCGVKGIHVDTTAGEIIAGGEVVAAVAGEMRLMVSGSGRGVPGLTCDDCEEG